MFPVYYSKKYANNQVCDCHFGYLTSLTIRKHTYFYVMNKTDAPFGRFFRHQAGSKFI